MRIAYVCADPGIPVTGAKGASLHVQAVLRVLVADGHEVHLITARRGDGEVPAGVTVHLLPAVTGAAGAEREESARRSDAAVWPFLLALAPDLVWERYSLWGRTGTAWAQAAGVPGLLEVNAPLVEEQAAHRRLDDRAGAEEVATAALTAAGVVLCVSDGVAAWARGHGAPGARVHTVPNGVDVDRVRPSTAAVTPGSGVPFTVGFVGTLRPWHGVDVLVESLGLLATDAAWRLLVVGDGPTAPALAHRAAELGVDAEFTGVVPPAEVPVHLHRMDVGCAPYPPLDPFYFSPLKVYEYLAAGLPVVASALGQIPEALGHGTVGELVPAGDPAALASALQRLRRDEPRRRELRDRGRATALERHTWTAVVRHSMHLAMAGGAVR